MMFIPFALAYIGWYVTASMVSLLIIWSYISLPAYARLAKELQEKYGEAKS